MGVEGFGFGVVVLLQIGGVAVGALVVPVLVDAGPVQVVTGLELLLRVEVEPTLAAFLLRAAVPGNTEGLQAAAGKFDQVLLQRGKAEGVFDLEVGELAVRAVGVDEEFAVTAEEGAGNAVVAEMGIVEIAQHAVGRGDLHGHVVV